MPCFTACKCLWTDAVPLLEQDFAKYSRSGDDVEALEVDMSEESGWKTVHGDVFRPPQRLPLLAACVGTGVQVGA